MKVKAILFALIFILIFICLPNRNQAYVGPPYYGPSDPLGYPSEHPWQDVKSPPGDDINATEINFGIVIIGVPTTVIIIRALQIESNIEITRQTPKKIEFGYPTEKGND